MTLRFLTDKNNLIAEQSVEWRVLSTEFEQSVSDPLKGLRVLDSLRGKRFHLAWFRSKERLTSKAS